MKISFSTLVLIVILVVAAALVGVLTYVYFFSPKTIRIGYLQGDLHQLAFFVAVDKGFFAEEGIDFDRFVYENGMREMESFAASEINVGYLGTAPATLRRIAANVNVTIVAGVNAEGSAIVARYGSAISDVSDLDGRIVAIPGFGTVQDVLLRLALEQSGLSYGDLNGKNPAVTGPWNMPTMLKNDQIDAYIAWEPYCARSISEDYGYNITTSHKIWPMHPCCVLAVKSGLLEKKPEIVKKIVKVHIRATRWILNNATEAVKIAEKWTGLSEEVINIAMNNIVFLYHPSPEGVKQYLQYMIQFGLLNENDVPGEVDTFIQRFVNTWIVEEVE